MGRDLTHIAYNIFDFGSQFFRKVLWDGAGRGGALDNV